MLTLDRKPLSIGEDLSCDRVGILLPEDMPSAVTCPQCGHSRIRVTIKPGSGKTYLCLTCQYEWDVER